ncbi:hypothetical protein A0128_20375 [Leptospira tipperaryensis]|uniref:Uncharacterized protein n=1 Tax=Leptospira tipperaryensis TaxID=2564040 RepID=A0A1D7V3H3_9LEPT|nr:HEPN domain-containing protein [Leptospira tipperaryensis]AOP36376.1 hypothetical protein A0128_20375 [Leptospira tipperaryensis]
MTQVEYILIFSKTDSYIKSIKSLKNLLSTNEEISISDKKLTYKKELYDLNVKIGEVKGKEQIYFDLLLSTTKQKSPKSLNGLLKDIRKLIITAGGNLSSVHDDLSLEYNQKLYPELYKIENKLRKLITKFMLLHVGIEWTAETLPKELQGINSDKKKEKHSNFLHSTDFIHLGDYLFKPYSKVDILKYLLDSSKHGNKKKLTSKAILEILPKSNWERYFKKIIKIEDAQLEKKWKRLYDLRCLIAHNNFISEGEFNEALSLIKELDKVFEDAIRKIDNITIPDDERGQVYESVVSTINENTGSFIFEWQKFELSIFELAHLLKIDIRKRYSIGETLQVLLEKKYVSEEFYRETIRLNRFRNHLVHTGLNIAGEQELLDMISKIKEINYSIELVRQKIQNDV